MLFGTTSVKVKGCAADSNALPPVAPTTAAKVADLLTVVYRVPEHTAYGPAVHVWSDGHPFVATAAREPVHPRQRSLTCSPVPSNAAVRSLFWAFVFVHISFMALLGFSVRLQRPTR